MKRTYTIEFERWLKYQKDANAGTKISEEAVTLMRGAFYSGCNAARNIIQNIIEDATLDGDETSDALNALDDELLATARKQGFKIIGDA